MTKLLSGAAGLALLAIGVLYGIVGLTQIDPGEVGLQVQQFGEERGMRPDTLSTGTFWVDPITMDVVVYDARMKQYTEGLDDMPAATSDGQPVQVDLSLQIGLKANEVPKLHEEVGPGWFMQVVYPATRAALRTYVAKEKSDEVYTGEARVRIAEGVAKELAPLTNMGIISAVNLREIKFLDPLFVKKIGEKVRAGQQIEIETRNAIAEVQRANRVAAQAEGEKQKAVLAAEGQREERRLLGEGERLYKEELAKGIEAVALAEAAGIKAKQEAVAGAGGATYASIVWAEQLGPNVKVLGYPLGAPGTTGLFNVDGVLGNALKVKGLTDTPAISAQ